MAKGAGPQAVNLSKLPKLAKRYDTLKSHSDDARSDLGNFFQRCEEDDHLNRAALKLALKIRGMEPDKRTVFLADLNAYCDTLGVYNNPGLFEDPQKIGAAGPEDPDDDDDDDDGEGDEAELPPGEGGPPIGDPAAKSPQQIEAFNLGEAEGRAGGRAAANPYTDETLRAEYQAGWEAGQEDKVHGQMGGRPRRRASERSLAEAEPAGAA